jgi:hypothetical protein
MFRYLFLDVSKTEKLLSFQFLVFAVSETSIEHAASFSASCTQLQNDVIISRGTPTSIVTVVIDEGIVRVSAPEPPPHQQQIKYHQQVQLEHQPDDQDLQQKCDANPESMFEMATSFSVGDESDGGLQVNDN